MIGTFSRRKDRSFAGYLRASPANIDQGTYNSVKEIENLSMF
jgi:hypothetical protein